ncbi:MAG: DUF4249 domain-containing protein [Bacteroidia bacterium]|nr:DUF4249 domain-containing protein [Bacteroidia bacterium]
MKWLILSVLVLFFSCEKDITVDLPGGDEKIVVEGYIEVGRNAYVLISTTTGYFAPVDSVSLISTTVKNALVIISDGFITDTLFSVIPEIGYVYYSNNIVGTVGRNYSLYIRTPDGKELTAETYCFPAIQLDSAWFKVQPGKDSLGFAWAHLTDPDTLGNCYRWFAKRLGKDADFIAPLGSVFNDKFINGTSYDFAFDRGRLPHSTADDDNNDERGFFKQGDTIVVKFCTVGMATFEFWRTAEQQLATNGNPFASVTFLNSNINGGIGIFEAYTPSFDTIIARNN